MSTLLNDRSIAAYAAAGMITPFQREKIRRIEYEGPPVWSYPVISYGMSSYGYDLTLSQSDFRVFRHVPGLIVDPKSFDERCLVPADLEWDHGSWYFILPAHTYALGVTRERLHLPDNVTTLFIGKSTYARCGIIVNTTPGEAGWEGYLTLEISNSSGADCRIYANEGICQAMFFESDPCERPYGDGKYQCQQAGVTLARVRSCPCLTSTTRHP